ncbi:hypothetical protein M3Y99_01696100 [Aphelenchoides fujianensis]|nr:hypothetical protein M3Y99_01696100 [Aphelenchoides fujianensis]
MNGRLSCAILFALALPTDGFLFGGLGGGGGGCDACGAGSYGGQQYGYSGGQDYSNYQNYQPQYQPTYQQPQQNVINGRFIIRHKLYRPVIRRTTVELIPQQGTVSRPYSTEFVPDQQVHTVQASQGFESSGPAYQSGGGYSNYGSGGGDYGSSYGSNYGGGQYGNYGSSYGGGQYGNGGYGSNYGGGAYGAAAGIANSAVGSAFG